jgi:hypothetical protein
MKTCTCCGDQLSTDRFYKDKKSADGLRWYCKDCCRLKRNLYSKENPGKDTKRKARYRKDNPVSTASAARLYIFENKEKSLYWSSKARAKKLNLPFNLDHSDIVIPSTCPVLGIKLEINSGNSKDSSPSLDRTIPALGYIKGNIEVISHRANQIKNNGTADEHLKIAEYITKRGDKDGGDTYSKRDTKTSGN